MNEDLRCSFIAFVFLLVMAAGQEQQARENYYLGVTTNLHLSCNY